VGKETELMDLWDVEMGKVMVHVFIDVKKGAYTTGNTALDPEEVNMRVVLKMNREFTSFMRELVWSGLYLSFL
jgi:hypothetical protein